MLFSDLPGKFREIRTHWRMPQSDANRSPTKLADFQQRFLAFLNKRRKFRLYGASDGQNQKS